MNFQYLHKAVQDEIRRPDRNDAITRALRATILQLHTSGFYSRAIVEDFIDISTPENYMKIVVFEGQIFQEFAIQSFFFSARKFWYRPKKIGLPIFVQTKVLLNATQSNPKVQSVHA